MRAYLRKESLPFHTGKKEVVEVVEDEILEDEIVDIEDEDLEEDEDDV